MGGEEEEGVSDPDWDFASFKLIGYYASKAALNLLTVQLAFHSY